MANDLKIRWKRGALERELRQNKNVREILHISEPIKKNLMLPSNEELSAYFINWNRSLERRDFNSKNLKEIRSEVIVDHPWTSLGEYVLVSTLAVATGSSAINYNGDSAAAYMLLLLGGFGVLDMGEGKWKRYRNDVEAWNKYQEKKETGFD